MRALVVYESMFGNTMRVAAAVAASIGERMPVQLVEVSHAPATLDPDTELLVVGGPTHGRGMSTPESRAEAASRWPDPVVSTRIGLREWLGALRPTRPSTAAAVFDTRNSAPMLFTGSAARGYASLLEAAGFRLIGPVESFLVGMKGKHDDALDPGQIDRAAAWGRELASSFAQRTLQPAEADPTAADRPSYELRREHDLMVPLPDSAGLEHGIGGRRV